MIKTFITCQSHRQRSTETFSQGFSNQFITGDIFLPCIRIDVDFFQLYQGYNKQYTYFSL